MSGKELKIRLEKAIKFAEDNGYIEIHKYSNGIECPVLEDIGDHFLSEEHRKKIFAQPYEGYTEEELPNIIYGKMAKPIVNAEIEYPIKCDFGEKCNHKELDGEIEKSYINTDNIVYKEEGDGPGLCKDCATYGSLRRI